MTLREENTLRATENRWLRMGRRGRKYWGIGEQQMYGSIKTNDEQDVWTMVGFIWLRIGTNAWLLYTW